MQDGRHLFFSTIFLLIALFLRANDLFAQDCQSPLLDNALVVQIDISSLSAIDQTHSQSLAVMGHLMSLQNSNDENFRAIFQVLYQNFYALWDMHIQVVEREKSEEERRRFEESKELFAVSLKDTLSFQAAYRTKQSLQLYQRYFSALQSYFSGLFISYGVIRSGLTTTSRVHILELGSGMGDSTRIIRTLLPLSRIFALDQSTESLEYLKSQALRAIPIEHNFKLPLKLKNDTIDMVISIAATSQYMDIVEFSHHLKEVYRVLKPGGYYLFEFGPTSRAFPEAISLNMAIGILKNHGFITESGIDLYVRTKNSTYVPILLMKPL